MTDPTKSSDSDSDSDRSDAAAPRRVDVVYTAEEISGRVRDLGRRLATELPPDPLLVSLLGGSVIFLADLVRAIDRPVRYEFIHVETSGGRQAGQPLALHYPIPFSVAGENVVLLKDVLASGVPEAYLLEQLQQHGARRVWLAALVDLEDQRKTDVLADFRAFDGRRAGTLVGYGLKFEGRYGNLPYIGRLAG